MFWTRWEPATGVVLDPRSAGLPDGGTVAPGSCLVEVRTASGEVLRQTLGRPRSLTGTWPPPTGTTVGLEFSPRSRRVRLDRSETVLPASTRSSPTLSPVRRAAPRAALPRHVGAQLRALRELSRTDDVLRLDLPDEAVAGLRLDLLTQVASVTRSRLAALDRTPASGQG